MHGGDDTLAVLTLYVDDILITGRSAEAVKRLKNALMDRFVMTNMGKVSRVLGTTITRDCKA